MHFENWSKTPKLEKQNKTNPPPDHSRPNRKKREKERVFGETSFVLSFSLKALGLYTHTLKKSGKHLKSKKKPRIKEEERRRKEEGRPSKPFNLQNHHQDQV